MPLNADGGWEVRPLSATLRPSTGLMVFLTHGLCMVVLKEKRRDPVIELKTSHTGGITQVLLCYFDLMYNFKIAQEELT